MRQLFACAVFGAMICTASGQSPAGSYAFSTFAGRAQQTGTTDGVGNNARFNRPWAVTTDAAGNVYVADAANYTIRKITPTGTVTTIAGTPGTTGNADGRGASAQFGAVTFPSSGNPTWGPFGVAMNPTGNLFVADSFSHTVRRLSGAGDVSTYSGTAGTSGYLDGPAASARYAVPWGIAVDSSGTIYVADSYNHVIRRISTAGAVTTIAGTAGQWGSADGIGSAARFLHPTAIAVDPAGRLYVTDCNNTVRRISPQSASQWETVTIAGTAGTYGTTDGIGAAARFGSAPTVPSTPGAFSVRYGSNPPGINPAFISANYAIDELPGIAADGQGNVYVCDFGNNTIRQISPAGVVTTIGGTNSGGFTDGIASGARFSRPAGIAVDARGTLYVADSANHIIRKGAVIAAPTIQTHPASQTAGSGATATFTVAATGSPEPAYQWARNGINISGATTATLTLANLQSTQAGTYAVTVANLAGSVTSNPATLTVVNLPTINVQPTAQIALAGQTLILSVGVGGSPAPTLQWLRDGVPIPGATNPSLVLINLQPESAGEYLVTATNTLGSVTSSPARVTVNTSRIVNLSIRSAMTGSQALIVGFVSSGGSKTLLMRAVGPTLRDFGVTDAMVDPVLNLRTQAGAVSATNDNWGTSPAVGQLVLAANQVGAFALILDSLDSAMLATATDAEMTVQAASRTGAGGIVLIELYDAAPSAPSRLVNVSARAIVGAGENALFAGFVVAGNAPKTLLIRAVGPTLGAFGVEGILADPRLDVFATGTTTPLASNDNWAGNVALSAAFRSVSAFLLPASDSRDAALLVSLQPGAYTAQVSGVGGLTGEVLLEIYELP